MTSSGPYTWSSLEQDDTPLAQSVTPNEYARQSTRTPSPTPSERHELETGSIDWKRVWSWRFWFRKEWACSSSTLFLFQKSLLIIKYSRVLCHFSGHYSPRCVNVGVQYSDCKLAYACGNVAKRYVSYPNFSILVEVNSFPIRFKFGWLVPIAVLFVLSFPPVCSCLAFCTHL